jgi:hypothetical protein
MLADKTVRGTNFTCFHAGPKEGWTEFRTVDHVRRTTGKPFIG